MLHISPVPSWCILTQDYNGHIQRAIQNGWCYKPGPCPSKTYYYPGNDLAPPYLRVTEDIPITASADGPAIIQDQGAKGYGLNVRQDTGAEELTIYAHLQRTTFKSKATIMQGELLGWMGWTGNVWDWQGKKSIYAKHLHHEIRIGGIPIDPASRMTAENPNEPPPPPSEVYKLPSIPALPRGLVVVDELRVRVTIMGVVLDKMPLNAEVPIFAMKQDKGDVWLGIQYKDRFGWAAGYYDGKEMIKVIE